MRLLARASVHLGRDSSALLLFERIGNRSMMADDLYLLGVALSRTGNDKGSTEVWTQGLRADPDHPQILRGMIKVNLKMDRFFEAAAEARRLAKQPAWQARANELLGRIHYARNDPAGAVEFWQRALEHESELTEAPRATICPVNPATGCISCHMPTVKGVIPHSPFTDHFIRVHRELSTSETRDKATTGLARFTHELRTVRCG